MQRGWISPDIFITQTQTTISTEKRPDDHDRTELLQELFKYRLELRDSHLCERWAIFICLTDRLDRTFTDYCIAGISNHIFS